MNKTINEQLAKIAVNKSLLKEYSNSSNERIVYMNDGTEFQIQIFNHYSYTIGVSFNFNEKDISYNNYNEQLLVIKPGQRVWLERYLDNESKLLFSTYKVGNSKAVKEAIKSNGILSIKFYKEKEQISSGIILSSPNIAWYNTNVNYNSSADYANYTDYTNCISQPLTNCSNNIIDYSFGISASTSTQDTSLGLQSSKNATNNTRSRSIETGRIDKGSHSNQNFTYSNIDFEYYPFSTEIIQILPTSQKPITSKDLQKVYCSNCGRKLNNKYKFCPYCGKKIEECKNTKSKKYVLIKCPYCGRTVRSNMEECPHCGEILL